MTRLPIPGSDDNVWGTVLNEYLQQAHKGDGTLKDNIVGTGSLQDGSITPAKIAT